MATPQVISKIKAGDGSENLIASSAYFYCDTAANTVAKVAKYRTTTQTAFVPVEGTTIHVRFLYTNTAASPTLTLQTNGGTQVLAAKPIYGYGTTVPGTNANTSWNANSIVNLTYDTTVNTSGCWIMNDHIRNTDTHWTTHGFVGASATATANATATNGNVYLNIADNTSIRNAINIKGTGATTVTANNAGVITIHSTDNNTTYTAASAAPPVIPNSTASVTGTSANYARQDHTHGLSKAAVTSALGYTPPTTNTTYTAGTGLTLSSNQFSISTVPIANGGTGATDAATARTNLGITPANIGAAASSHTHSYLPLSGGTVTGSITATKAGEIGYAANNTTKAHQVELVVGSSGKGGVYDRTNEKWIVYSDTDGTATLNGTAADSSKLNGYASDTAASNNTIARRTANGYLFATYLNQSSGAETPTTSSYVMYANSDGYLRKSSLANIKSILGLGSAAYTASTAYAAAGHTHNYAGSSSVGGAASSIALTDVSPDSLTTYCPLLAQNTTAQTPKVTNTNGEVRCQARKGTTTTPGIGLALLGNATAAGTANNAYGVVRLYGEGTAWGQIKVDVTSNRSYVFPDVSGNVPIPKKLYGKNAGATSVELSDEVSNYEYLRIFYGTGTVDNGTNDFPHMASVVVYSPHTFSRVGFSMGIGTDDNTWPVQLLVGEFHITTSTTITLGHSYFINFSADGATLSNGTQTTAPKIFVVEGWN